MIKKIIILLLGFISTTSVVSAHGKIETPEIEEVNSIDSIEYADQEEEQKNSVLTEALTEEEKVLIKQNIENRTHDETKIPYAIYIIVVVFTVLWIIYALKNNTLSIDKNMRKKKSLWLKKVLINVLLYGSIMFLVRTFMYHWIKAFFQDEGFFTFAQRSFSLISFDFWDDQVFSLMILIWVIDVFIWLSLLFCRKWYVIIYAWLRPVIISLFYMVITQEFSLHSILEWIIPLLLAIYVLYITIAEENKIKWI